MVRPILQTDNGLPTVLCGISTDFDTVPLTNQISFNPSTLTVGVWDTSTWDNTNWGGNLIVTKFWQGVTGIGYAGSISMNVASQGIDFHWASTDYVMERGGVL
jgi:plastocyanin